EQWFRLIASPSASNGQDRNVVVCHFDISEQILAERALLTRETRLQDLANTMPFAIWTADASGTVLFANNALNAYSGVTQNQGSASQSWIDTLHPDDVAGCIETWKTCVRHGTEFVSEFRIRR